MQATVPEVPGLAEKVQGGSRMSETKIKIKDLATELNIAPKEVLAAAKKLDIPAKNATSTLTTEEARKVRGQVQEASGDARRKDGASDVIIRRRRKGSGAKPAAREEAAPAETEAQASPAQPEAKAAAPAAEAEEAPAAKPAPAKARKAEARTEAPRARIIRPATPQAEEKAEPAPETAAPAQPAPEAQSAAPEKVEAHDAGAPVQQAETTESAPAEPAAEKAPAEKRRYEVSMEPEKDSVQADTEADGDADGGRKKKKKKKREETAGPQVRVISRPDPAAVQAQAAAAAQAREERAERPDRGPRPAGARPAGPRPGGPRQGDSRPGDGRPAPRSGAPRPGGARPAAGFGQPAQAENSSPFADGQSKKKRQKGRRTVEFGDKGAGGKKMREDVGGNWNRGKKGKRKPETKPVSTQPQRAAKRKIKVDEAIRVSDFAHQMGVKAPEIIKILMSLGIMATINQSLDIDTATVVAAEFGYEVEKVGFSEDEFLLPKEVDADELLLPRPPVVTIMGHVDHGKTSLLDAIRKSSVTTGEAGGITQHIGAYHVSTKRGDIVFLDTPGHEAFTAMRARGAQVTDLVILVVAADDGVMEQTREAISHAKAAGVPIVVAVNKIDKEGANRDRVMRELAEQDLVPEEWGGDTIFSYVSAKTREGLDDLLEMLALQAEVLELKANPDKPARGRIVEAKLDKGRGAVGTVLIQEGTLKHGDAFVCGVFSGRVRAMFNDQGKKAKQAGPSIPVEVQGFEGVPVAGEEFICVKDEKVARRIAEQRAIKQRERDLARESKVTLETFLARRKTDAETQTLNLVLKADVQGSVGAITDALRKMQTEKVKVDIIHSGAGAITESDILLASASDAIIIGFNVRPTAKVKDVAEQEKVEIRFYDIIYKLSEEIKSAMAGLLAPVVREQYLGQAEVRETFSVPKVGTVAGCHVADGKIIRNTKVRLLRDGVVIYTGRINSLKRFKDDVKEVAKGFECGMGLENYNDIKIGDIIEAFEEVEEAATLD